MARPWSRKRNGTAPAPRHIRGADAPVAEESVQLDASDHAWWAQADVERAWTPKVRPSVEPEEPRDILAEHFGEDWRTNFGFEPGAEEDPLAGADDDRRAYRVLEVDPSATWDEIVAAHRQQVRTHHPDRLFGQSEEEQAEGEERIRVINAAYQELKIRRGV